MVDLALETLARELASEVDEAVPSGQESPHHEQEFTRIVLDCLADDGALENPIPLWQERTFGRTIYKINGYSIPDDEERLVLIAIPVSRSPAQSGLFAWWRGFVGAVQPAALGRWRYREGSHRTTKVFRETSKSGRC